MYYHYKVFQDYNTCIFMARENREIRRKTRYTGQSTYIQSNCFIFDPTTHPRFIPVLFEIVQEALLLPRPG